MTDNTTSAPLSTWIGLTVVAAISFWCQAVVTEERFVPALNFIAIEFNIPDDVAGATLMAAGASSPELLSSFISLFITHSALGLGTIVGSEIFNQLIICAGAVFAARSGTLQLDPTIVTREVLFYALSIGLLYAALQDKRPDPDDESAQDHIYVSFFDAAMIFSGYLLYIVVLVNTNALKRCFKRDAPGLNDKRADYGSTSQQHSKRSNIDVPDLPFLKETSLTHEPASNFAEKGETVEFSRTLTGQSLERDGVGNLLGNSIRSAIGQFSDGTSLRAFRFMMYGEKPSDQHNLTELEIDEFDDRLSCFLWQQSYFYSKARFATRGWHLRWFAFTAREIYSVPDRSNFERHRLTYPHFKEIEVDENRHIIRIKHPSTEKRDFFLMAPSAEILLAVVKKMESIMHYREEKGEDSRPPSVLEGVQASENTAHHLDLLEYPSGGSRVEIIFFVLLFPLRFLMNATVPDVRALDSHGNPTATTCKAFLSILSCLVWLIVGSYAMVTTLEALAELMQIPDAVVGVTVSAAGTSLPNYVASKVAAQNGFGNMAVSNAFGSNTFNIMIGLGLPWVIFTSFGTGFQPYHGLRDEGITESVIILGAVLLVFVLNMVMSGFVMYKWHGILYITLYVVYLGYVIAGVYLK